MRVCAPRRKEEGVFCFARCSRAEVPAGALDRCAHDCATTRREGQEGEKAAAWPLACCGARLERGRGSQHELEVMFRAWRLQCACLAMV